MLYQQIARNKRKTAIIMVLFVIILTLVGAGLGYMFSNSPYYYCFSRKPHLFIHCHAKSCQYGDEFKSCPRNP